MKLRHAALALTVTMALAGCTTGETGAGPTPQPVALNADSPPEGTATVFLRGRAELFVKDRLVVDVVARGVGDLHGAAFRLTWDPDALAFVEGRGGAAWSKQSLAIAKEALPGQLVVAWTEKGELAIDAAQETVLGTLTFDVRGKQDARLAFKTERSQLVDKKGGRLAVAWRDATISPAVALPRP